jgi:hypothetical protein
VGPPTCEEGHQALRHQTLKSADTCVVMIKFIFCGVLISL